ncbi:MAG: hypothetical protein GXY51_05310, partial [Bacteroidetes bacterium]|nr:hypothetical protein [Bacteroidota bacterium]
MKNSIGFCFLLSVLLITGCTDQKKEISKFDFTGPRDPSLIRGFNYTP